MNFTYNNHLKYYIDGVPYGYRQNSIQNFKVSVGSIDQNYYRTTNFKRELLRTADLVYQNLGKDLVLFLSGGTDSEIVLRNFLEIGIRPRCFVIKFKGDYNDSDVQEAINLAKGLDVKFELINFDVKDFFYSGEASEFGAEIQCTQITYLTVYKSIKEKNLPSVMGGELMLKRNIDTDPSSWYYCLRENEDCSAMRFSIKYNIPLVNEYFSYTPELMLSYLENEKIQSLTSEKYNYKLTSVSSKNAILKELIPEIKLRKKTHGFEKLLAFNYEAYRSMAGQQIARLENSLDGIEYHACLKMLRGEYAGN